MERDTELLCVRPDTELLGGSGGGSGGGCAGSDGGGGGGRRGGGGGGAESAAWKVYVRDRYRSSLLYFLWPYFWLCYVCDPNPILGTAPTGCAASWRCGGAC